MMLAIQTALKQRENRPEYIFLNGLEFIIIEGGFKQKNPFSIWKFHKPHFAVNTHRDNPTVTLYNVKLKNPKYRRIIENLKKNFVMQYEPDQYNTGWENIFYG